MDLGGIVNEGDEKVFLISTTHGGETHAIRAGIKTIEEFKTKNVIKHIHRVGDEFIEKAKKLIQENGLDDFIEVSASSWMITFLFKNRQAEICNELRTYFLQQMISRGVLFQGAFVPCLSHDVKAIDDFMSAFNQCLIDYKTILKKDYTTALMGKPTKAVFRKYN